MDPRVISAYRSYCKDIVVGFNIIRATAFPQDLSHEMLDSGQQHDIQEQRILQKK